MKLFFIMLAMLFLNINFSIASANNGICESFADNNSAWGPCTNAPNITSNVVPTGGPDNDSYLQVTDRSGNSALCSGVRNQGGSNSPYVGDWTKLSGTCQQFCFDVRLIRGGAGITTFQPYIGISSGAERFVFRSNKIISTDNGNTPGWHRICPIIKTINNGDNLPSNSDGQWQSYDASTNNWVNSHHSQWNAAITNVENLDLPGDFTSEPSEIIGYDNLCLGDCPDPVKPTCSPFNGSRLASLLEMTPGNPLSNPYLLKVNPNLHPPLNNEMQDYIDLHANNGHGANSLVVLTEVFDSNNNKQAEGYHCWTKGVPSNPACKEFSSATPFYNLLPGGFQEGETYNLKTFVFLEGAGTGWVTDYIPPQCDRSNRLEFNWTFRAARTSGKATFNVYDQSKKLIREIPVK